MGWFQPRVLVSTALLERLTPPQLGVVVAHERAHAQRRDALALTSARLLSLAHLPRVRRQILADLAVASEQACDEIAARACGDRVLVAETIVAAERAMAQAPANAVALAFGGSDVEAEVRRAFVSVLAVERRVAVLRAAATRLEAVTASVGRRAASGDVAGYDRRRVERERLTLLARLDIEEGALARARALLAALVGAPGPESLGVRGDLAPAELPALPGLLDRVASRSDLQALALEAEAGELEARAAGRWLVPEVELGGGLKTVDTGSRRDSGFAAAVTTPLPLFSRDQDERVRGDARARAARARLALALEGARAEVSGLHAEASRLGAAAERYARSGDADASALTTTAEAAYRGGEVGVLELVDAYRATVDSSLALVDLQAAARRARIELDRASGGTAR